MSLPNNVSVVSMNRLDEGVHSAPNVKYGIRQSTSRRDDNSTRKKAPLALRWMIMRRIHDQYQEVSHAATAGTFHSAIGLKSVEH
jgi:hypothetical protein